MESTREDLPMFSFVMETLLSEREVLVYQFTPPPTDSPTPVNRLACSLQDGSGYCHRCRGVQECHLSSVRGSELRLGVLKGPLHVIVDCANGIYQRLSVTQNLHGVLQNIRSKSSTRIIWIDAICNGQKDDIEKRPQVGMMDRIYKR